MFENDEAMSRSTEEQFKDFFDAILGPEPATDPEPEPEPEPAPEPAEDPTEEPKSTADLFADWLEGREEQLAKRERYAFRNVW